MVATLVVRNANEAMMVLVVGSGVWRSVLCWCVWQESGFSRCEDLFIFNLLCTEIL
jgi:hypothetical protein